MPCIPEGDFPTFYNFYWLSENALNSLSKVGRISLDAVADEEGEGSFLSLMTVFNVGNLLLSNPDYSKLRGNIRRALSPPNVLLGLNPLGSLFFTLSLRLFSNRGDLFLNLSYTGICKAWLGLPRVST